jgi:hypothetical protein
MMVFVSLMGLFTETTLAEIILEPGTSPFSDGGEDWAYGISVTPTWPGGGVLWVNFPEHLEYGDVGMGILRYSDTRPNPWVLEQAGKYAHYEVDSLTAANVRVEASAEVIEPDSVKFTVRIINNSQSLTLGMVKPLLCYHYRTLTDFPQNLGNNFDYSYVVIDGEIIALSDIPTDDPNTTVKGGTVEPHPPHRNHFVVNHGGWIEDPLDLALAVVTSFDDNHAVILHGQPGRSVLSNRYIPCLHGDPYYGNISPGDTKVATVTVTFVEGDWRTEVEKALQLAKNPSPRHETIDVNTDADLSWMAGEGASSHDVYFGTSLNDVANGTRQRGDVDGNGPVNWEDVRVLHEQWLLDNTGMYPCADLNGDNFANLVDLAVIGNNWRQQADAVFMGNQQDMTFDPGTLAGSTTYYWRIDEPNALSNATGAVWSFTTEIFVPPPGQASNPNPADSAADTGVGADLSWTAGAAADSHDVYFGTDSTPDASEFQGNHIETTFDPGTLNYATTYYWRIDETNTAGTTAGIVWSFTTAAAGASVIEEFGDAAGTDHPGTIEDTWCRANFDNNYSTTVQLNTYTWPANNVANLIIIKWDLSAIPTDATVVDATLYLYQVGSRYENFYDIPVHKIINVNPVITACTWNTYDGTNSWTAGADGGQGDTAAAEVTQPVNLTNNKYKIWTVTDMIADWVSTPASNYGMLVNSDDVANVDSYRYFASTEAVDASTRPRLVIAYTTAE